MIFRLFRQNPEIESMTALYGTIVAQARAESFYRDYGVPDTLNGRFEMLVLHAILLLRRLNSAGLGALGQRLFDHFCRDMDGNLREIGVSDLAVPRQMQRIGQAFYGRQQAYTAALAASDEPMLAVALMRNVFGSGGEPVSGAKRLAAYVSAAVHDLAAQNSAALSGGQLHFPSPGTVTVGGAMAEQT